MTTCLLPGCNNQTPTNIKGRPSEFCCNAHRQAFHRLIVRLVNVVVRELADEQRRLTLIEKAKPGARGV